MPTRLPDALGVPVPALAATPAPMAAAAPRVVAAPAAAPGARGRGVR